MFWKKPSLKQILPPPVKVDHAEYSMILSAHDDPFRPTPSLLDTGLRAIQEAAKVDLRDISSRLTGATLYPEIWPGEHYKLLAGLVLSLEAKTVIEIGTATGLSALCLKKFLPPDGKLITFDIVPWEKYPGTVLKTEDFEDQRLIQHLTDLSNPNEVKKHIDDFNKADLIFIDAPHDGHFEKQLLKNFHQLNKGRKIYLCFDDIRVWTMLKMWREVSFPKIDLTSFGHWSGTGLVEFEI